MILCWSKGCLRWSKSCLRWSKSCTLAPPAKFNLYYWRANESNSFANSVMLASGRAAATKTQCRPAPTGSLRRQALCFRLPWRTSRALERQAGVAANPSTCVTARASVHSPRKLAPKLDHTRATQTNKQTRQVTGLSRKQAGKGRFPGPPSRKGRVILNAPSCRIRLPRFLTACSRGESCSPLLECLRTE